jgi:GAF domain-containing protein
VQGADVADSPLTTSLAALSRFFVGDGTLEETLTRVADLTVEAVPSAEMVGITMIVEGRNRTAIFTDEAAPEIDAAQYDSGEGPCLEAFQEQHITTIESTHEPGKWPEFRRAAAAHGIESTISFPLVVDKAAVGAMNLYSRRARSFGDTDRETGMLFASQAAIVLANAQAYWDARELSEGLGEAMKHRAVIEQAKGLLMGAEGCDEDEAFQMLVRASQRENVKLRTIAQRIIDDAVSRGRSRAGEQGPSPSDDIE